MDNNLLTKVTIIGMSTVVIQEGVQKMLRAHESGDEASLAILVDELQTVFAKVGEHLNDVKLKSTSEVAG